MEKENQVPALANQERYSEQGDTRLGTFAHGANQLRVSGVPLADNHGFNEGDAGGSTPHNNNGGQEVAAPSPLTPASPRNTLEEGSVSYSPCSTTTQGFLH